MINIVKKGGRMTTFMRHRSPAEILMFGFAAVIFLGAVDSEPTNLQCLRSKSGISKLFIYSDLQCMCYRISSCGYWNLLVFVWSDCHYSFNSNRWSRLYVFNDYFFRIGG